MFIGPCGLTWAIQTLDIFELFPISKETLALALEDWEIWLRWHAAFHSGETNQATHPALPEDRARAEELKELLMKHLTFDDSMPLFATADFEWQPKTPDEVPATGPAGVWWTTVERPSALYIV